MTLPAGPMMLAISAVTPSGSTDPTRPDYTSPLYREMEKYWTLVKHIRGGTPVIREYAATYLPKFESEETTDWLARINMTFVQDHYSTTLEEHVGLVLAIPPKIQDDVPEEIQDLLEDFDGEGNHFEVFAHNALDAALHLGHAALYTDMPDTSGIGNKREEKSAGVRPYVTLYDADDVMSARFAVVGGVRVLVRIVLREHLTEEDGAFGEKTVVQYRVITQEVLRGSVPSEGVLGSPIGLGSITWETFQANAKGDAFISTGTGPIIGPIHIPARIVYGGEKFGPLHTRPHLVGMAWTNLEETQVGSDYAAVMHKCNVPTPIFRGRIGAGEPGKESVQMGQGIDVAINGGADMLEPKGTAIDATRDRIGDLREQMKRQGATTDDAVGKTMTAAEARLYARQRNAKLARAARSLQDALEGVFEDMAAFMKLSTGGSVKVNQDFAGIGIDPAYLQVLLASYKEHALPLDAYLYALQTGNLPDEFKAEEVALKLLAEAEKRAQEEADRQATLFEQQKGQPPIPKSV